MRLLARALNENRVNMESAFSASRLGQREKWNREDYRRRTIDKALEGATARPAEETPAKVLPKPAKRAVLLNAIKLLNRTPEWNGVLAYNEFNLQTVARKQPPWKKVGEQWTDADDLECCAWSKGTLRRPGDSGGSVPSHCFAKQIPPRSGLSKFAKVGRNKANRLLAHVRSRR